jgi:hypothetical protein
MDPFKLLEQAGYFQDEKVDSDDYFDVGTTEGIVASNSSLSWINPDEGGSYTNFELFFTQDEEKKVSNSIEKGKGLHKWLQHPDDFIVHEANRPSDKICEMMEVLYERTRGSADFPAHQGLITIFDQLKAPVVEIAREASWNSRWDDEAVFRNIKKDGEPYFNFLIEASGKQILTPDVKQSLDGMQQSIYDSEVREYLLDLNPNVVKEAVAFFELEGVRCKMMLDNLIIDPDSKRIIYTDVKSTSTPVSKFMGYHRYGWDDAGLQPRRIRHDGPFQLFRYYRQMGFYDLGLREVFAPLLKNSEWKIVHRIVAVENKDLYQHAEIYVPWNWVIAGHSEAITLIHEVKNYISVKGLSDDEY